MIREQYRMHPEISKFPSNAFYNSKLKDAEIVINRENPLGLLELTKNAPRYAFLNLQNSNEDSQNLSKSHSNLNEAKLVSNIVKYLVSQWKSQNLPRENMENHIGVIAPYRKQVYLIKRFLSDLNLEKYAEINTVDSFQGREKNIIIITAVRAGGKTLGFLTDYRRMNVGITRAKHFLWIIGHSETLSNDYYWKMLISNAKDREKLFSLKDENDLKILGFSHTEISYSKPVENKELPKKRDHSEKIEHQEKKSTKDNKKKKTEYEEMLEKRRKLLEE